MALMDPPFPRASPLVTTERTPAQVKEYTQTIDGIEYTFLLDAEDAERRGLTEKAKEAPPNKAHTPTDKSG